MLFRSPAILPNQIREDALMDNITCLEAHVTKAKGVLSDVTGLLSEVFEQLLPRESIPPTLPEIVQKLTPINALLDEFTLSKTKAGARAAITFATASGIDGDYEKAYADFPNHPNGKKVQLKNYAERSGKLADLLAKTLIKIASTEDSAYVAPYTLFCRVICFPCNELAPLSFA